MSGKVSEATYKNGKLFPLHGSGQGSSNSPHIWLFISSVLYDVYDKNSHGMKFSTPDRKENHNMGIIGIVDDATCSTDANPVATVEELLQRLAHDAQLWHDLLWCSGG